MKIALLLSYTPSRWESCQSITPNILKVYKRQSAKLLHFNFHRSINALECLKMAQEIKESGVDLISFVDHSPHPKKLLIPLEFVLRKVDSRPKLVFHLYGDFTLFSADWMEIENLLKHYKCKFLVASDRQQYLVSQFIETPSNKVFKFPFPVNENKFWFDKKTRENARERLNIGEKTPVFIYTGRISPQKNLLSLVKNIVRASKWAKSPPALLIAGGFDNLGTPFVGDLLLPHDYSFRFHRLLRTIDPQKTRIEFLGHLNLEELFEYYNAADTFVSLSGHNDEDFGMAPLEAMFCGNRSILTDWGGFASFQTKKAFCQMVPVNFVSGQIVLDHATAVDLYAKAMMEPTEILRRDISHHYKKMFGIRGLTSSLNNILRGHFSFFKSYKKPFYLLNFCLQSSPHAPFIGAEENKAYGPIYKDIYAPYFRDIPQSS